MYSQKEKKKSKGLEPQDIQSAFSSLDEKTVHEVRYMNVVQRNIAHGARGFYANSERIAISSMPVVPGMDRSHTVSDRDVQDIVANWMNEVVRGTANSNLIFQVFINIAGEEVVGIVFQLMHELTLILTQSPLNESEAVRLGNQLYDTVANSRFNLRPGNSSGNRSTSRYIDLFYPEIETVLTDDIIVIKISQLDAESVFAMLEAGIPALVRIKGAGAVSSSSDSRFSGETLIYQIITIDNLLNGFAFAYARKVDS